MASEAIDIPPSTTEENVVDGPSLPFDSLEEIEFSPIRSGPRISSCHNLPKSYYGPVTIRNYLAGYTKKMLRKSKPKDSSVLKEVFLRMPIELKLVVLEHLHPIDLYHFSQVSKAFRKIIMDPKSAGVWKTSFEQYPELPCPPPNVTQSQWAFMLFGPGICGECGKYGALTDFGFLKRFCELCMKGNYCYIHELKDTCGNVVPLDHTIWSLIPRSYRYNGLRYTSSYATQVNAKFSPKDFYPMMKKITLMRLLLDSGVPELVPELADLFQEYKEARTGHIDEINECANKANTWAMDIYRQCSGECDNVFRDITEICKKRLHNLGHETQDIDYVQYSITHALRQDAILKLTSRAFRKIRPKLEKVVTTRKQKRLEAERQELLENIYKDYQKALAPDTWQYLPQARLVSTIEGFSEFLNAKFDKRGDMSPAYAVAHFPGFISNWTKKHQKEVVELLPATEKEEDFETKLRRLEFATSVITCMDCKLKVHGGRVLLGWNNICRHKHSLAPGYVEPCSTYALNEDTVASAASLVSCVGLDPATATIHDMDVRDDRFLCGNCMSDTVRGITGLKAYTWIECIQHMAEMNHLSDVMHSGPAWLLLTPEATRFVREHEYPHPRPVHDIWRCNHCPRHFDVPVNQKDAIEHAKKVHVNKNPVIGVDVVQDKRITPRRRRQFRLGLEPAFECKCSKCPETPIYKLWEIQALTVHLRKKHQVPEPVEGTDWVKIKVIAAAASAPPQPDQQPNP